VYNMKSTTSISKSGNGKPPFCEMQSKAVTAYLNLLRLKNYSESTISTYRNWFMFFLGHFPDRKPSEISKNEILDFLTARMETDKWSATVQNQLINAIKFFYEQVVKEQQADI
jgi:integrase/recombinase XerD